MFLEEQQMGQLQHIHSQTAEFAWRRSSPTALEFNIAKAGMVPDLIFGRLGAAQKLCTFLRQAAAFVHERIRMNQSTGSLKLTPITVAQIVNERLAQPTIAYVNHISKNKDVQTEYIENAKKRLLRNITAPEFVIIEITEFHSAILKIEAGEIIAWKIAQEEDSIIFYEEQARKFGKADAKDKNRNTFIDVGFRTEDPLEAYLA